MSGASNDPATGHRSLARTGDLSEHSPDAVLAFCEAERFTGSLKFESGDVHGALPILGGVPEIPESDKRLGRAFEAFAAAREG